jgi:hypothetical protein
VNANFRHCLTLKSVGISLADSGKMVDFDDVHTKKTVGNPLEPALCVSGLNVLLMGFQNLVSDCPYLSVNPGYKIGKSAPKMGRRFVQITKYPRGRAERF